jgi:hypothetical protein
MSKIKEHIEKTIYDYDNSWKNVRDKREHLENLTSVIFKEVFDICWKHCDTDTLYLIMEDIDRIKEENDLPI